MLHILIPYFHNVTQFFVSMFNGGHFVFITVVKKLFLYI